MTEDIEYGIARDLWSRDIRSITGLNTYSIKKIESIPEVNLEHIDELLLDNWDIWNKEMEEHFKR